MTPTADLGRALRLICAQANLRHCGITSLRVRRRGFAAIRYDLRDYIAGGFTPIATVPASDEQTAAAALLKEIAAIRKELNKNEDASKRGPGVDQTHARSKAPEAA